MIEHIYQLTGVLRGACTYLQDTYAYALVLLCLAVGEIDFVQRAHRRGITPLGWRPTVPQQVGDSLKAMIEDMWQEDHTRRPTFERVVPRLQQCSVQQQQQQQRWPKGSGVWGNELPTLEDILAVKSADDRFVPRLCVIRDCHTL